MHTQFYTHAINYYAYTAIHIIIAPHVAMYIDKVAAKDAGTY